MLTTLCRLQVIHLEDDSVGTRFSELRSLVSGAKLEPDGVPGVRRSSEPSDNHRKPVGIDPKRTYAQTEQV